MLSQGNIRGRYHSACQQQSASVNTLIALHCLSNIYCCGQCLKEVHDKDHVIFYDNDVVGHQITSLEGVELKTNKNCCYPAGVLRGRLLHRNGNFVPLAP